MDLKLGLLTFSKFESLAFLDISQNCVTSSRAEISNKLTQNRAYKTQIGAEMRFSSILFLLCQKSILFVFYQKKKDLIKLTLHKLSFTYHPTASFFRNRIVEWSCIKSKIRPMLFKEIFYSNAVRRPFKLTCLTIKIKRNKS